MQSQRASLFEAATNLVVGFALSWWTSYVVIPAMLGVRASPAETTQFVGIFTAITLVRSYALRRLFNWWHVRQATREKLAIYRRDLADRAVERVPAPDRPPEIFFGSARWDQR